MVGDQDGVGARPGEGAPRTSCALKDHAAAARHEGCAAPHEGRGRRRRGQAGGLQRGHAASSKAHAAAGAVGEAVTNPVNPAGGASRDARWTSSRPCSSRTSSSARPPGPSTRIDLTGAMFSMAAPSPAPVTITPHLVGLIYCPPDESGQGVFEVIFRRGISEDDEQIARNVSPFTVDPGKFTYRLVRGELEFADYGPDLRPLPHRSGRLAPRAVHVVASGLTAAGRDRQQLPGDRSGPLAALAATALASRVDVAWAWVALRVLPPWR